MNGENLPYTTLTVVPFTAITSEWGNGIGDDILALASGTGLDTTWSPPDKRITPEKLADYNRKNAGSNTTIAAPLIQHGWAYIEGNGTANVDTTVTFPVAYSSTPVVLAGFLSADTSGAPTDITEFTTTSSAAHTHQVSSISTTSFGLRISRASGNMNTGTFYGVSWIAIGAS